MFWWLHRIFSAVGDGINMWESAHAHCAINTKSNNTMTHPRTSPFFKIARLHTQCCHNFTTFFLSRLRLPTGRRNSQPSKTICGECVSMTNATKAKQNPPSDSVNALHRAHWTKSILASTRCSPYAALNSMQKLNDRLIDKGNIRWKSRKRSDRRAMKTIINDGRNGSKRNEHMESIGALKSALVTLIWVLISAYLYRTHVSIHFGFIHVLRMWLIRI